MNTQQKYIASQVFGNTQSIMTNIILK